MKKKLILGSVGVAILAWAGASFVSIFINLNSYKPVVAAMQAQFPELQIQGASAYEGYPPRIYLRVYGVTDPAQEEEIRQWLVAWNDQHKRGPIRLRFYAKSGDYAPTTQIEIAPR